MPVVILSLNILLNLGPGFQIGQLIHLVFCVFGSLVLLSFWYNWRNDANTGNRHYHWVALFSALAVVMWMAIDVTRLIFDQPTLGMDTKTQTQQLLFINLFSAFNNAFLLATLFSFPFGFKILKERFPKLTSTSSWALTVIILNVLFIIFYIINWSLDINVEQPYFIYIDGLYSIITLTAFCYVVILNYSKSEVFGRAFTYGISLFMLCFLILNFLSPLLTADKTFYRYTTLYSFHIILMTSTIMLLLGMYLKEAHDELGRDILRLEEDVIHSNTIVRVFETEIAQLRNTPILKGQGKDKFHGEKRYLKFYRENDMFVLELTMLDKGITGVKMQYATLTREYKDLLQFAIYRKSQLPLRSRGGSHKAFGDIYKAIHDIRKRLMNPKLEELGLPSLTSNELIVQNIKGSGIYELECARRHIEIDVKSLSKNRELMLLLDSLKKPYESDI